MAAPITLSIPGCSCCGGSGETFPSCSCALDIPAVGNIAAAFADPADAVPYMDGTSGLSDCYGWVDGTATDLDFTADNSTDDVLILTATYSGSADLAQYAQVSVAADAVLTIDWALGSSGSGTIRIYTCDWTLVETASVSGSSGTHVFAALPVGQYLIECHVTASDSAEFTITSDLVMVVNPVIASFLDGSDTWILEACPRLEWPLFPTSFFSSFATATAGLARTPGSSLSVDAPFHQFPVDCLAIGGAPNHNTADATAVEGAGPTTLELMIKGTDSASGGPHQVFTTGCLNLLKDAVLSVSGLEDFDLLGGAGATNVQVILRNPYTNAVAGTLYNHADVGTHTAAISGSIVVPHTGKWNVQIVVDGENPGSFAAYMKATATFSSDLEMSVNPVQAKYTRGVTCFARLDC